MTSLSRLRLWCRSGDSVSSRPHATGLLGFRDVRSQASLQRFHTVDKVRSVVALPA